MQEKRNCSTEVDAVYVAENSFLLASYLLLATITKLRLPDILVEVCDVMVVEIIFFL